VTFCALRLFTDVPQPASQRHSFIFGPAPASFFLHKQQFIMEISRSYLVALGTKRAWQPLGRIKRRQFTRCIATHTHSFHADQISVIRSSIDPSSTEFKENEQQMKDAISKIRELNGTIAKGGSTKARDKHVARGKMLVREYALPP
jgi:hypothetical protein